MAKSTPRRCHLFTQFAWWQLVVDRWVFSGVGIRTYMPPHTNFFFCLSVVGSETCNFTAGTAVAKSTPWMCHFTRWFGLLLLLGNSRRRWRLLLVVVVGAVESRDTYYMRPHPKLERSTYPSPVMHRRLRYIHQAIEYTVGVPPHAHDFACCCCWAAWSQRCATNSLLVLLAARSIRYSYICAHQELQRHSVGQSRPFCKS